jgi:hypothetical protein
MRRNLPQRAPEGYSAKSAKKPCPEKSQIGP